MRGEFFIPGYTANRSFYLTPGYWIFGFQDTDWFSGYGLVWIRILGHGLV